MTKSYRSSILLLVSLALLTTFVFSDSYYANQIITGLTKTQTMHEPPGSFPIPAGAYQQTTVLPPSSMDMRWWILHTQSLLQSDSFRVRETQIDNAPTGREMHWSSGLIWLIALLARGISFFNGKPPLDCAAQAAIVAPLFLLAFSVAVIGTLVSRRLGWGIAGLFVLVLFTSRPVYEGFIYGMADHHGIVFTFAAASVLALVFGGAGLVNSKKTKFPFLLDEAAARRWMILSGILGGAALWVSAATAIPVLAGCGAGAVAAAWIGCRNGLLPRPALWHSWGLAGCLTSLFFYALEYFPFHLGWRLEVNHPLHALAWLSASELLARLLSRLFTGGRFTNRSPGDLLRLALALAFVFLPPLMAFSRPDLFFFVSDKFLLTLHKEYICEFQPIWIFLLSGEETIYRIFSVFMWPLVVVLGIPLLLWRRGASPVWRSLAAFASLPLLVMQALAFSQIRWQGMASGLWLIEVLILLMAFQQMRTATPPPRFLTVGLAAFAFVAAVWNPQGVFRLAWSVSQTPSELPKNCAPTLLLRDVAHRLLQSSPGQIPFVLAGPTTSTEFSYYGHIRTLGTLYWENVEGLKKAARIFAAPDADTALRLIQQAGITHIVVASWDDFGMDYVKVLKKAGEISEMPPEPFVKSLLDGAEPPRWIRPLYYPIPAVFGLDGAQVRIFAVTPDQSPEDALIHRGIYQLDAGVAGKAKKLFHRILSSNPSNPQALEGMRAAEALSAKP